MRGGPQEAAPGSAFRTLTNSGSGSVTALISVANLRLGPDPALASNSGCEAADFRDFERGSIALVRRGTCTFQTKVENAVTAGAAGVVIMNEGTEGRKDAFSGQLNKVAPVPVLGVSYEFGRSLDAAARHGTTVRIAVDAETGRRPTRNVLAETVTNGRGPLIIVGAHLDSVQEGPGINDNGSGSAAVLEAALRSARELTEAGIAVRFAFWGAEEQGLVGSRHHVASLSEEERQRIALYVNLDMVGSINFVRYVQGPAPVGDGLATMVRRELLTFESMICQSRNATGPVLALTTLLFPKKASRRSDFIPVRAGQSRKLSPACSVARQVDRTIPVIIGLATRSITLTARS